MATNTAALEFLLDLCEGRHNFNSDSFRVALSNTAPASETSNPLAAGNNALTNVTQITYTNYSDDLTVDRTLEGVAATLTTSAIVDANDFQITATGGNLPTFRYVYMYNDTATGDLIVCAYDHGSGITLSTGDSVSIDFGADSGSDGDILNLARA